MLTQLLLTRVADALRDLFRQGLPSAHGAALALCVLACSVPALAMNVVENNSWQFQSTTDKSNQMVMQDMAMKRQSGAYAAPVYITNIARQFNCNVSAGATGNSGVNSTVANSPSTSGASTSALGSQGTTSVSGLTAAAYNTQSNSGFVSAGVNGSTSTSVQGSATQALNSTQTNSGVQSASIGSSQACMFSAIN